MLLFGACCCCCCLVCTSSGNRRRGALLLPRCDNDSRRSKSQTPRNRFLFLPVLLLLPRSFYMSPSLRLHLFFFSFTAKLLRPSSAHSTSHLRRYVGRALRRWGSGGRRNGRKIHSLGHKINQYGITSRNRSFLIYIYIFYNGGAYSARADFSRWTSKNVYEA